MKLWHKMTALFAVLILGFAGSVAISTSTDVHNLRVGPLGQIIAFVRGGQTIVIPSIGTCTADDVLCSAQYTPGALSSTTNLASSNLFPCTYKKVGPAVSGSCRLTIDPTSAGQVVFEMDLPIPTDCDSSDDVSGGGHRGNNSVAIDSVYGSCATGTDKIQYLLNTTDAGGRGTTVWFEYTIQ